MQAYLSASNVINWQHPEIRQLAAQIALDRETTTAIAKACFEWVHDQTSRY